MGGACSNAGGVNNPQPNNKSEQKYEKTNNANGGAAAGGTAETSHLQPIAGGQSPNLNKPTSNNTNDSAVVPQLDMNAAPPGASSGNANYAAANNADNAAMSNTAHLIANQENYKLIKETWAQATKKSDFAISVYHKLLMKYQAATEALFYGVDIALQSQRLVDMIGAGVKLLDKPDSLIPVMLQLGSRHVIYGVSDAHFDMFNDALAMALQDAIGYWNAELTTQWVRILTLFKTMILHGYTTPAGLQMRKKYNLRVQRGLFKCWRTIMETDTNDDDSFVTVLHRFGRQKVGGRAEMFNNIITRRVPFMAMMNLAFEKGPEDPEVVQQAHELGARHIAYGVEERDYDAYAGPFIAAIQQKAAPDTFNPFVKAQLSLFWVSLTKLMLQGAAESKCGFTLRFAPKAPGFALIMANIEKSTQLWEGQQEAMTQAVQQHYRMLRELIQTHDAYEVGVDKDSFTIACKDITNSIILAMRLQVFLLRNPIEGFVMDADTEGEGPREVWNNHTLRVRVAVHWCKDAQVNFNVNERKYEYTGPDVEICKFIADTACGGQTVVTEPTLKHFLNIGKLNEATEYMGDLKTINGRANPKLTEANGTHIIGETAKLSDVFQHKVFSQITIPVVPAVAALGYGPSMASSTHPAVTNLISIYPACLAAREFRGRKRIPAPQ